MPDNIATQIADALLLRQLRVARVEAGVRAAVLRLLQATEADILDALKRLDPSEPGALVWRKRRLEHLLTTIRPVIQDGYGTIADDTGKALLDIASAEVEGTALAMNQTIGVNLIQPRVAEVTLRALVNDTLLPTASTPQDLSATGREWWRRHAASLEARVFDTMNVGIVQSESLQQLVTRVRGTRAKGYTDGVMDIARRDAQRLVRTHTSMTLNQARNSTYSANQDIIKGLKTVATMDGRTSLICIARDGSLHTADAAHTPIAPTVLPFLSGPPWHFNCRSTTVPILKSFREIAGEAGAALDVKLQAIGPGTRASMDGQVPADTTFQAFLERKGEAFQKQLLGEGRWQMWTEGKLSLPQLLDSATGEILPISALRGS